MKPLSEVAKNIPITAVSAAQKPSTSQHGLIRTDGKTNTTIAQYNPPIRRITAKNQAISLNSLLRRAKPVKTFKRETIVYNAAGESLAVIPYAEVEPKFVYEKKFGETVSLSALITETTEYPGLTDEERTTVEYHNRPAHSEVIQAHLLRLAAHKHLAGDETQKAYLLTDYTRRLDGVTELALFMAVEYLIEHDDNKFFPPFAQLNTIVKEYRI